MKKTVICSLSLIFLLSQGIAQTNTIDKKWRFGLRVTPQSVWLLSSDKNNVSAGRNLSSGFGLNVEYRFSNVAAILWGVGGDFEGGDYTFKNDPAGNYVVKYLRDADEFVTPDNVSSTRVEYTLKSRTVKTTHVSLPLILKLNTAEYNGFKYFGMFGLEAGIRVKATADDSYSEIRKVDPATKNLAPVEQALEEKDINIADETALIPVRLGLNAGIGTEYRLGGTTSLLLSINFFRSFTNLMSKTSDYAYYRTEISNGTATYSYIRQNLKQSALRLTIGIMF